MTVLAANKWANNAALIADCAKLGYLKETDKVLDPTYGKGLWWTEFRPANLISHDIRLDGVDFRKLREYHGANQFDAAVFDPPYVSTGGRDTSTIPEFNSRYGLTEAMRTPLDLQLYNCRGLEQLSKVVKPSGYILTKCQDYISSGKFFPGTYYTIKYCREALEMELVDRFEHIGNVRMQPGGRRQVHARRNLSTLLVFRNAKR